MMTNADPTPAKALILAMSRFGQPLPHHIQAAIHHLTVTLRNNHASINDEIRQLVAQDPHLHQLYTAAYDELEAQYQNQERSKSFDLAFPRETDLWDRFIQIASANDSVLAARQTLQGINAQHRTRAKANFWEIGDRIVVMMAGGAFLGSLIAQIPGAIVGALIAGIFGWMSASAEKVGKE